MCRQWRPDAALLLTVEACLVVAAAKSSITYEVSGSVSVATLPKSETGWKYWETAT